ncbi:MAG: hypothetical protein FJ104_04050 [Deltaproteobacteria bacterium]|nr:hypothetical protein [Deltaproteobacteria bacterium]
MESRSLVHHLSLLGVTGVLAAVSPACGDRGGVGSGPGALETRGDAGGGGGAGGAAAADAATVSRDAAAPDASWGGGPPLDAGGDAAEPETLCREVAASPQSECKVVSGPGRCCWVNVWGIVDVERACWVRGDIPGSVGYCQALDYCGATAAETCYLSKDRRWRWQLPGGPGFSTPLDVPDWVDLESADVGAGCGDSADLMALPDCPPADAG